jgi:hypothetical protein
MFRVGVVTLLCMLVTLTGFGGHGRAPRPELPTPTPMRNVGVIVSSGGNTKWHDTWVCLRGTCKHTVSHRP